ncbi:hypothetical protein [Kitasatospora sp. NPDC090091]|uniref:hypothetical protein n=1 Tax=Kitasatospora sp. NPDC090091 TaxID=3364081 RepID=UPI00381061BB
MKEITRTEWFALGVVTLTAAGAAHAVAGAANIARDMMRPQPAGGSVPPGGAAPLPVSGRSGWILFGAMVLAGSLVYHIASDTEQILKEILGTTRSVR